MQKLTVVICTHNRSELLYSSLESINNAERPADCKIDILIIANACTDNTVSQLTQYKTLQQDNNHIPLSFDEEPKAGKSYALNLAITLAQGDFLCFVDDDQKVDRQYFQGINNALKAFPEATLLCGPLFPDWQGTEPDWIRETGQYRVYPTPVPMFNLGDSALKITQENQTPTGGQVIIHRDVFKRVGQFSEDLGPTGHNLVGSEDTEFFMRALDHGEILQYVPDIIQYHYVDPERLKLNYLLRMSYQRNRSITMSHNIENNKIPYFLWRKLLNYFGHALFSSNLIKFRFNLLRCAGILGQISGHVQSRQ